MLRRLSWALPTLALALVLPAAASAATTCCSTPDSSPARSATGRQPAAPAGVVSPGYAGSYAAQISFAKGATYGLRTSADAVSSTTVGHAYYATAEVRSDGPARTLCQRLREYALGGAHAEGDVAQCGRVRLRGSWLGEVAAHVFELS